MDWAQRHRSRLLGATSVSGLPRQPTAPSRNRRQIGTSGGQAGGAAPVGDGDGVVGGGGRGAANANATPTARLDRVNGRTAAADPDAELSGSLSPGVMLVGEGKKEDLIDRAREMGLDVLLLFNVRVSSSRVPTGTANLKVINLHSDDSEVMFNSRSLKSDVVAKNRAAGISEKSDPVVSTLDSLFEEASIQICGPNRSRQTSNRNMLPAESSSSCRSRIQIPCR